MSQAVDAKLLMMESLRSLRNSRAALETANKAAQVLMMSNRRLLVRSHALTPVIKFAPLCVTT